MGLGGRKLTGYRESYVTCMIKSSKMRLEGHVACVARKKNVYRVFMEKSEGKRLLGKHAHRWEDNIKLGLKEMGGLDSSGSR